MAGVPLLQRYIFGEMLRVFCLVLVCITVLLVFVGVFQQATESGLSPQHVLAILPFVVPSMLPFTIPAALLLTVSLVYGKLAGDLEVTAAKAAGIHPFSLMWPAVFLGAVLSVGGLLLTDQIIPWSIHRIERQVVSMMEDVFFERLRTELKFSDPERGIYVSVAGVDGRRLIQPRIQYARSGRVITIHAEEAVIKMDFERQEALVRMRTGFIDFPGEDRVVFQGEKSEAIRWERDSGERKARHLPIVSIQNEIEGIEGARDVRAQRRAILTMMAITQGDFETWGRVQTQATTNSRGESRRRAKLHTEIHSRYAFACSCFFFAVLGTPFSMRFGKSQFLTSFLLCFLPIVCGYYPLMLGMMTQAKHGNVAPEWGMWVGNAVLLLAAGFWARRVVQH